MSNRLKKEMEKIEIPEGLHERSKRGVMKARLERPDRKIKKVAIPLGAAAFLLFSTGIGAAHIPSLNHLVSIVSPEIANLLQPIEVSTENDGIKVEVVAAMNDGDMAVIYVTLQDKMENRIDETLDLYDYSLTGARMFNSQVVHYDEETKTATVRIQGNGGEHLNDKKISLRINSFLSDQQTFDATVDTNLSELAGKLPQTIPLDMNNIPGGGGELFETLQKKETLLILKPNEIEIPLPEIEFMQISNMGIIDEYLHIQARWSKDNTDNHGYFYFEDDAGNPTRPASINFGMDGAGKARYGNEYTEYIFDMDQVNLEKQKLRGYFVSNGNLTAGEWDVTFNMKAVQNEVRRDFKQSFEAWNSTAISISPLGVTLYGSGKFDDSNEMNIEVKMTDGSVVSLDAMTSYSEDEKLKIKFMPQLPLKVSEVKSVIIDGSEVRL